MSAPTGFLHIALTANPTAANPTWTRVDNLSGVLVQSIEIDRGRPTEWDKTAPGIVTIRGTDTAGVFDPTNASSPLYPNLQPVKQAAVCVKNEDTGQWQYLFRGHISYVENDPDVAENWQNFEIQLVDMLDILNDSEVVPDFAGNSVPTESMGDTFYDGQHVDDRILAVLADASTAFMKRVWPPSMIQMASGNISVQGSVYSRGTALLRVIDEACDAEFPDAANRFVTTDGQFAFRGRFYRFDPTKFVPHDNATRAQGSRMLHWFVGDLPAFQSGIESFSLAVPTQATSRVAKEDLVNAALVTAKGVTNKTLAGGTMFVADPASVSQYGVRTGGRSMENLIIDGHNNDHFGPDDEAATYADAIVQNYKDPCIYINKLVFKTPVDDGTQVYANNWRLLTEIELSDLISYYDQRPGGGGFPYGGDQENDHFVESIKYEISALSGDTAMVQLSLGLTSRHHYRYVSPYWVDHHPGSEGAALFAGFQYIVDGTSVYLVSTSEPGPSGPITDWTWDWGDGSSDSGIDPYPSHTYATGGTYNIVLTITGTTPDGTDTYAATVTVGDAFETATQRSRARIAVAGTTTTQTAVAAVQNTASKTQTAKANIGILRTTTQTGKVRVQKGVTKAQTGKIRVSKTVTKTQTAKLRARVVGKTKTQTSIAKIA